MTHRVLARRQTRASVAPGASCELRRGRRRRPRWWRRGGIKAPCQTVSLLKRALITPLDLEAASRHINGPLGDKLHDLAVIMAAYDARMGDDRIDPDDLPAKLAEAVRRCALFDGAHIYIDGFTDFTAAELRVVTELLRRGLPMTVCLTCDGPDGAEEPFEAARRTASILLREAEKYGIEVTTEMMAEPRRESPPELLFLEQNLFSYAPARFEGEAAEAVELYRAKSPADECEYAAARVLSLVREGARWRDIAVAAGDWGSYGALLENIFDKYGIPYYTSRRTDLRSKPPVALIESALEIVLGGWEYEAVFRYLKTGLAGLDRESVDLLENYVLMWNIRGTMWTREAGWALPPGGYDWKSDGDNAVLERLNALRRFVAAAFCPRGRAEKSRALANAPRALHS